MASGHTSAVPDARTCEQARLSRDPRFDGLFFTAVTSTRIYCRSVFRALLDGDVDFTAERPLEDFIERWKTVPGINRDTAHYIALRALGHPDAFPGGDVPRSESWRPWRGYAWIYQSGP